MMKYGEAQNLEKTGVPKLITFFESSKGADYLQACSALNGGKNIHERDVQSALTQVFQVLGDPEELAEATLRLQMFSKKMYDLAGGDE